jgi:Flp pilus assembly protein TadD
MSLMNDALRKKGSELKQLAGSVGTFRKKSGSVRSRKWRYIGGFSIAFLVVVAAGSALHFFFFRAAPTPMTPVAAPVAMPESDATGNPTPKEAGGKSPDIGANAAPDPGNQTPDSEISTRVLQQRIFQPAEPDKAPATPVEKKNTSEKAAMNLEDSSIPSTRGRPTQFPKPSRSFEMDTTGISDPQISNALDVSSPASPKPKKVVQTVVDPAERFYQKAVSYHQQNRLPVAIELYLTVLRENPGHTAARFNLAAAYIQTAAYSEAFPLLETLRARDPENPDILLNMAISKIGSGDLQQALMFLNAAEGKHGPAFELCFHRGVIFSRGEQPEEALRWYQMAEGINPHHDRLVLNIALTYDKLQQHEAALRYYLLFLDQAVSFSPGEKETVAGRVRVLRSYLGRRDTGDRSQESE